MEEITVLIKKVGEPPFLQKILPTVENFTSIVGGHLELVVMKRPGLVMYCDEEGLFKNKHENFVMGDFPYTQPIVGDVVFFRADGPCESSLDPLDIQYLINLLNWQIAPAQDKKSPQNTGLN